MLRIPRRHSNPYATHLPILAALGNCFPIRKVLELGSGLHSTAAFLNQTVFPDVKRLQSYENDADWGARVSKSIGTEPRFNLVIIDGLIAEQVHQLQIDDYDLVFIDDSSESAQRLSTIAAVAAKRPQRAVVVVHDVEFDPYRRALFDSFDSAFRFTAVNPNVGIAWNKRQCAMSNLKEANSIVRRELKTTAIDDLVAWRSHFS